MAAVLSSFQLLICVAIEQPAAPVATGAAAADAGGPAAQSQQLPAERPAIQWSREETMLRTCSWGGLGEAAAWQSSALGGSDFFRRPRRYQADQGAAHGQECTKHQRSNLNLLPGVMLYWCMQCRRCIFFHVMDRAESPRCASIARMCMRSCISCLS